ncbi:MAG: MFS transporter [Deltaproteobacteria bacterium]|nr:MFS transporter [Deltaproteobacteria bacterium]MBW2724023.1 MFS transporter [Deltaproteobacteria bacterium]
MTTQKPISPVQVAAPLDDATRARGRRLAITSHPAGMTFWTVHTEHIPTLLLVSLGASEFQIGLQGAFLPGLQLLQLPTLRRIAQIRKRTILLLGQVAALLGALPLLFLDPLLSFGEATVRGIALVSFALVAAGLNVGNTVWFPMLRSYVDSDRIGHFFGLIRSSWHLALIVYFVSAQQWLLYNPGDYATLFAAAWLLGLLRMALIARMPERSERTEGKIRVREAFARVREDSKLRRYLVGVTLCAAIRTSTVPFAIVMMRREIGFSESQILLTTLAYFGGGLVSLYLWGRVADRIGSAPVFRITAVGMASLLLLLVAIDSNSQRDLMLLLFFFFGFSLLTAGFGVADTRVLFQLSPPEAPARTLVISGVITNVIRALAPILVGVFLEQALSASDDRLAVYHGLFAGLAVLQMLAFIPLQGFTRSAS